MYRVFSRIILLTLLWFELLGPAVAQAQNEDSVDVILEYRNEILKERAERFIDNALEAYLDSLIATQNHYDMLSRQASRGVGLANGIKNDKIRVLIQKDLGAKSRFYGMQYAAAKKKTTRNAIKALKKLPILSIVLSGAETISVEVQLSKDIDDIESRTGISLDRSASEKLGRYGSILFNDLTYGALFIGSAGDECLVAIPYMEVIRILQIGIKRWENFSTMSLRCHNLSISFIQQVRPRLVFCSTRRWW